MAAFAVALLTSLVPAAVQAQGRLAMSLGDAAFAPGLESAVNQAAAARTPSRPVRRSPVDDPEYPTFPAVESDVFGQWLFGGHFARQSFTGFNPGYVLGPGDQIEVRLWGGFDYQALLEVDGEGQVFIPRLGPLRLAGVRNGELNRTLESRMRAVFREDVGVYASLVTAQSVKVFVGGNVVRPGLYGATASDSILHYLDRAGGVAPAAGSYRAIQVLRGGKVVKSIDLYDFLQAGTLPLVQFRDGDIIFVAPRGPVVRIEGLVAWPREFELAADTSLAEVLNLAQPGDEATHFRLTRALVSESRSEVHPMTALEGAVTTVQGGDVVEVYADRTAANIVVRVQGEHQGRQQLVLPYGATLDEVLQQLEPTSRSDVGNLRLFRQSLIERQRQVITQLLNKLEESVLTARSKTQQEAALRTQEAQLILQFVERARAIEPRGQVILQDNDRRTALVLEDGDVLDIPRKTQLVGVHGEVYLPAAFSWDPQASVADYIAMAGGFTQSGSRDQVLLMRPSGAVQFARVGGWFGGLKPQAGDELLIMPRVDQKSFQFGKDVVEVIYQIAIAAGVLVRL